MRIRVPRIINWRMIMASSCSVCRAVGGNMKMCKKCNNVWCANCSRKGEGHYPKSRASNVCPYCNKSGGVVGAK
jgi:hypothetical protein